MYKQYNILLSIHSNKNQFTKNYLYFITTFTKRLTEPGQALIFVAHRRLVTTKCHNTLR